MDPLSCAFRQPSCRRRPILAVLTGLALGWSVATAAAAPAAGALHVTVAPQTLRSDAVTLRWNKPEAAPPALAYRVFCDGKPAGETSHTYFTVRPLTPDHRYVFTVQAALPTGASTDSATGAASVQTRWQSGPLPVRTPAPEPVVSITQFGAKGDGVTLNTKPIQAAIDACPPHGIVSVPAGVFVTGALFLKSDITLEIARGGVLQGSTNPADYLPFIPSRFEGWDLRTYASLLNAGRLEPRGPANVRHLSIRGQGTIRGGGTPLAKAMIAAHGMRSRGRLICLVNCDDVEVQGVTLDNSPCWTLQFVYSRNVTCHDLTIHSTAANGDGIDPDSSANCDIFDCTFSTGDDCIAIKSGKNPEGNAIGRPTEHVRISDCRFLRGHAIAIGSEMSGGVRDVRIEDCVAGNLMFGLQIKGTKERGGYVRDVSVRDCDLQKIMIVTAVGYNNDGAPAPEQPTFRDFRFEHIDMTKGNPRQPLIVVQGFPAPGHRTTNVVFDDVRLPAGAVVTVDQAENVRFTHVATVAGGQPRYDVTRSSRVIE